VRFVCFLKISEQTASIAILANSFLKFLQESVSVIKINMEFRP
jgi:hypothetical protein